MKPICIYGSVILVILMASYLLAQKKISSVALQNKRDEEEKSPSLKAVNNMISDIEG